MTLRSLAWFLCCTLIGTAAFGVAVSARPACPIKPIELSITGGRSSGLTIELRDGALLGGPNGLKRAMVWDEPMRLHQPGGAVCTVDAKVGIITPPMFNAGGRVLYVTTYSGSHSVLFAVNAANCDVLWASQPFRTGPILAGHRFILSGAPSVTVGKDCLPERTAVR